MELFLLYIWLKLDTITTLLGPVTVLTFLGGVILSIFAEMEDALSSRNEKHVIALRGWRKICLIIAIPSALLVIFLPTSKQMAVLVGGHYALKISESPEAAKVMSVLRKKANEYLDNSLSKNAEPQGK